MKGQSLSRLSHWGNRGRTMRKILSVVVVILLASFIYAAVENTAVFTLNWYGEDAQYLRFGFASAPPSFDGDVAEIPDIMMSNPVRSGSLIEVTNSHTEENSLYAFCEAYSSARFDINISAESFSYQSEADIPFTVSWNNGSGSVQSHSQNGSGGSAPLFTYTPDQGLFSSSVELTVEASLPDDAAPNRYTGKIILELEVL